MTAHDNADYVIPRIWAIGISGKRDDYDTKTVESEIANTLREMGFENVQVSAKVYFDQDFNG